MGRHNVHTSHRFDKDAALAIRRGKDTTKLMAVITLLTSDQPLPGEFKDHQFKGYWKATSPYKIG